MPILLYIYLAIEILTPFFASLLILNGILFLGRLIPLLDTIFSFGIGFTDFIRLSVYMAPKLLVFSLPMASMIGVIVAFTRMSNDNEIMAFKACGIGLNRMLPPVLVVAFCTAALTWFSATTLIPEGTIAMKKLFLQLAKEKIDRGIQEKQFSDGIKNIVLYVDYIDPETGNWQGVYLSDMRHPNTPVTILAQKGRLTANVAEMQISLYLTDGTMVRMINDLTQTINFKQYTLILPLKTPARVDGGSAAMVGKNGMTQAQLLRAVAKYGTDSKQGISMLIEYHERLVLPVGCFILTVLALPLALLSRPGRRPYGVVLGLGFFVLYYILFTAGKTYSESALLPVAVTMWLPNFIFLIFTVLFTVLVARESYNHVFDRLALFAHKQLYR